MNLFFLNKLNFDLFKNIIHKAYWPIYGEIKMLDDDLSCNGDQCEKSNELNKGGVNFSFFALMVYMIIANVLLINLLIAMFRYA